MKKIHSAMDRSDVVLRVIERNITGNHPQH